MRKYERNRGRKENEQRDGERKQTKKKQARKEKNQEVKNYEQRQNPKNKTRLVQGQKYDTKMWLKRKIIQVKT